jgi:hypothetical protein
LLVDLHVSDARLQRGRDLRSQLVNDYLPHISAGCFDERYDGRIHHRLQHSDGFVVDPTLQHHGRHLRDTFSREHAADRQHGSEEPRDQQPDGTGKQHKDDDAIGLGRHGNANDAP